MTDLELYHFGVKGMKWGKRKARLEKRATKRLSRAAYRFGEADYERSKGAEAYRQHDTKAKAFDKTAAQFEKSGKFLRAEAARTAAASLRKRGENIRAKRDAAARLIERDATKLQEKANKYATKKRVDLGKSLIDSIMSTGRRRGYNAASSSETARREGQLREKLGGSGYNALNKIRGT